MLLFKFQIFIKMKRFVVFVLTCPSKLKWIKSEKCEMKKNIGLFNWVALLLKLKWYFMFYFTFFFLLQINNCPQLIEMFLANLLCSRKHEVCEYQLFSAYIYIYVTLYLTGLKINSFFFALIYDSWYQCSVCVFFCFFFLFVWSIE